MKALVLSLFLVVTVGLMVWWVWLVEYRRFETRATAPLDPPPDVVD